MIKSDKYTRAFTLLEVMVALMILAISLTAISRSQQNSVRAANRAKWMTVATMLARYKMVEVEDELFKEGFSDFQEEQKGDFDDEGFERYSFELKIEKIELPSGVDAQNMAQSVEDEVGGTEDSDSESPQGMMLAMGTKMMGQYYEIIRNTLEQGIRRVQLKVTWKEGTQIREVTVVSYFTDPRKIDAAAGGEFKIPKDPNKGS